MPKLLLKNGQTPIEKRTNTDALDKMHLLWYNNSVIDFCARPRGHP